VTCDRTDGRVESPGELRRHRPERRGPNGRPDRDQRLAAAGEQQLVAPDGSIEPIAKVVAERMAADGDRCRVRRVELGGLEPPASCVPRRRSGQLSYSPFEIEVVSKVNACSLSIPWGCETQPECVLILDDRYGNQETTIELRAIHADKVDFFRV
jgi:hypothetical protein